MREVVTISHELEEFLRDKQVAAEERVIWGNGTMPLQVIAYYAAEMPPPDLVSSARALLFRDDSVLVIRDAEDSVHILPGGRREVGETIEAALERELLEETGWTVRKVDLLGLLHFHHLGAEPGHYPYPYPDFCQVVFMAQADRFVGSSVIDPYVVSSRFERIDIVQGLNLPESQLAFLRAAVAQRNR